MYLFQLIVSQGKELFNNPETVNNQVVTVSIKHFFSSFVSRKVGKTENLF